MAAPDAGKDFCRTQAPLLLGMLQPQDGQIQFLHYWRACGMLMETQPSLALEVETLRDSLLLAFEAGRADGAPELRSIALSAVKEQIARQLSTSCHRVFWHGAIRSLDALWPSELDMETCAQMLVGWLLHAASEAQRPEPSPRPATRRSPGAVVSLHVYDVSRSLGVQALNAVLAHRRSPLKLGGIFHVGVEIAGIEWGYGFCVGKQGMDSCLPGRHRQHHYRQTVSMPRTRLSPVEVDAVLSELMEEYRGSDYNLLRHNCCHFAEDLCRRLGVGPLPRWLCRLARAGAALELQLGPGCGTACSAALCREAVARDSQRLLRVDAR